MISSANFPVCCAATARWCEAIGGCGAVLVLHDPERESYAAWGLGRSSLSHFMGRRSLGVALVIR